MAIVSLNIRYPPRASGSITTVRWLEDEAIPAWDAASDRWTNVRIDHPVIFMDEIYRYEPFPWHEIKATPFPHLHTESRWTNFGGTRAGPLWRAMRTTVTRSSYTQITRRRARWHEMPAIWWRSALAKTADGLHRIASKIDPYDYDEESEW